MAALVSSRASHMHRVSARNDDDLEQVAECRAMRVEQVVVREVRALAEDEQRRHADVLEARRRRGHLAVGRDHGGLAVAVAHPAVVSGLDVRREILDDELARREVELALVVAAFDQLVEGDVRLVEPRVLGSRERDVAGEEDRRVEKHELRDELRRARGELERETPAERVPDEDRLARADRLDDRVEVRGDVPRRLPGRVAVSEQIGGEDVVAGEARRQRREVPPVIADAVQADDARPPGSPHSWSASVTPTRRALRASPAPSRCAARRAPSPATRSRFRRGRSGTCRDAARRSSR